MVRGDIDAFVSVFSNNLATLLVGATLLTSFIGPQAVYDHVVPGIAMSLCFGCVYYVIQAQLKSAKTGRLDLRAQPFGINTPGVFAFVASIIAPVYFAKGGDEKAMKLAWHVGIVANFVQGVVEIALSIVGPWLAESIPMVALLGSLASIGIAYLYTGSLADEMYVPLVGLAPFYLMMMAMYAGVQVPKLPSTLFPVLLGTAMAWVSGFSTAEQVSKGTRHLGWHPCRLSFEAFSSLADTMEYIPVILPVALTVSVGSIQCRQLAANAGDEYNLRASMLGDGIATVIAALFGSPYGMTTFIGHSAFKKMGAHIGYLLLCAAGMVLVAFSGFASLLLAVVPAQALNPVLMFVGLAICSDALSITPERHWPAFMVSLVPGVVNWAIVQMQIFGRTMCEHQPTGCVVDPSGREVWTLAGTLRGIFALGQGYLLVSIFLTTMLVFVIDRKFGKACIWAIISALCASCGLIHSGVLFAPWTGPAPPKGVYILANWDMHWTFTLAYSLIAAIFLLCYVLQRMGLIEKALAEPMDRQSAPCSSSFVEASKVDTTPGGCNQAICFISGISARASKPDFESDC